MNKSNVNLATNESSNLREVIKKNDERIQTFHQIINDLNNQISLLKKDKNSILQVDI